MSAEPRHGRWRQRRRTRKDLLEAANRLLREGSTPSLDEVASAAEVSRATAYRYFPNVEALLAEAALDVALPGPDELFADDHTADPAARVERVDAALDAVIADNEVPLRLMLARSLERAASRGPKDRTPLRQNRRTPLIEAALAPENDRLDPKARDHLVAVLAVLIGTESAVAFRDVLQIGEEEAREAKRWAIRALVDAAREPPR